MQQLGHGFVLASFHCIVPVSKSDRSLPLYPTELSGEQLSTLLARLRRDVGVLVVMTDLMCSKQVSDSWWLDTPHCKHNSRSQLLLSYRSKEVDALKLVYVDVKREITSH